MSRVTLVTFVESIEIFIIANLLLARAPNSAARKNVWLGIVAALIASAAIGVAMFYGLKEAESTFENFEQLFAGFIPVILASLLVWHATRSHKMSSEITGALAFALILVEGVEIVIGTAGSSAGALLAGIAVLAVTLLVMFLVFQVFQGKHWLNKLQQYATVLIAIMAVYQLIHARGVMEEGGYESWWWLSLIVTLGLLAYWFPRFIRGHDHTSTRT